MISYQFSAGDIHLETCETLYFSNMVHSNIVQMPAAQSISAGPKIPTLGPKYRRHTHHLGRCKSAYAIGIGILPRKSRDDQCPKDQRTPLELDTGQWVRAVPPFSFAESKSKGHHSRRAEFPCWPVPLGGSTG
jgi:hypothetical protein